MPRGFLDLDVQFPRLEGMEDDRARFISIEDHERMMLENLRYILRNIGPDNFNQPEVIAWLLSLGLGRGEPYKMVGMEAVYEVQTAGRVDREAVIPTIGGSVQTVAPGMYPLPMSTYPLLTGSVSSEAAPVQQIVSGGITAAFEVTAPGG